MGKTVLASLLFVFSIASCRKNTAETYPGVRDYWPSVSIVSTPLDGRQSPMKCMATAVSKTGPTTYRFITTDICVTDVSLKEKYRVEIIDASSRIAASVIATDSVRGLALLEADVKAEMLSPSAVQGF